MPSASPQLAEGGGSAQRRGVLLATAAVLAFSSSPVLVRWAAVSLGPYEIAAVRLLVAGAVVLGLACWQGQPLPARSELPKFALFGLITALHLVLIIASLSYTTIAHSLSILYTAPIFVALFAAIILHETITGRRWAGILTVVAGVAILAGFEPLFDRRMLIGDFMALGSAVSFAFYSLAGSSQRTRYGLFAYAGTVYTLASCWTLPLAAWTFTASGYTPAVIASLLALALIPLAIGHTLFNAALRHADATEVNVVVMQEVVISITWGALFLHEIPASSSAVGVLITLIGVVLVLRASSGQLT